LAARGEELDASSAKAMPGVLDVVQIPDGVVADTHWHSGAAVGAVE
jgi:isoquinoline 1-oxidoreductase beta subunit